VDDDMYFQNNRGQSNSTMDTSTMNEVLGQYFDEESWRHAARRCPAEMGKVGAGCDKRTRYSAPQVRCKLAARSRKLKYGMDEVKQAGYRSSGAYRICSHLSGAKTPRWPALHRHGRR